jgi:hypothetical protein
MTNPPGLRVADDEREHVAAQLREHFAAGRLTTAELDERLGATYAARTEDELKRVLEDLPVLPAAALALRRAELATRRSELSRHLVQRTGGALVPFFISTGVWALTDPGGDFWPAWVALVALIPVVRGLWGLYGPAPELDRVEAELRDRRDGEKRRRDR